jgi:hypothetical protein
VACSRVNIAFFTLCVDNYFDLTYNLTCSTFVVVYTMPVYHGHVMKKKTSVSCGILLVRKMNLSVSNV